jgi:hypothetical protein
MRSCLTATAVLVVASIWFVPARAQHLTVDELEYLTARFPYFFILKDEGKPLRYVYADWGRIIRVYQVEKDRATLVWESPVLGSQVSSLVVKDLNGDGTSEILVSTHKGRIVAWNTTNYDFIGENLVEPFKNIDCLAVANLDNRGGLDAVFIAEGFLNIYDLGSRQRLWRSDKPYAATEMLLANVDTDEQLEIILNSGYIIDARFYNEEQFYEEGFGVRMSLIDVNGDEYPDIIGETTSKALLIYDIYGQRELFPQW